MTPPQTMFDTNSERSEQLPSVEEVRMMQAAARRAESDRSLSSKPSDIETAFSGSQEFSEHDQLPSVEDVRLESPRSNSGSKRCLKVSFWTALLVIVTVTAVTLAVVLTKDESSNNNNGAVMEDQDFFMGDASVPVDSAPATPTTAVPIQTDAPVSTNAPVTTTTEPGFVSRVPAAVQLLSEAGVSTKSALERDGSPQQRAVWFVADQDPAPIALGDADAFVERYVLTVLFYSMGGEKDWTNSLNFLSEAPTCRWYINGFAADKKTARKYGASCNDAGRIANIHFPPQFLQGTLPSEMAFLRQLERFEAFNNPGITGGFPTFFREMTKVDYIGLHYCGLVGVLPAWIGDIKTLQSLILSNNNFSGILPASLSELAQLENLYLDDCNFEGDIEVLRGLTNLKNVVLEDNTFKFSLDDSMVSNWAQLETFDASHNRIESTIPSAFFQLQNLRVLDLHGNNLFGSLPKPLTAKAALETLTLNENSLTGAIPAELSQFVNLKQVDFTNNKFSSTLPSSFGTLQKLEFFYAAKNPFNAGPIPSFLSQLTALKELSLKDTQLVDNIPDWIGSLSNLILLDLDNNRLVGTVPDTLAEATSLEYLLLNRNELEGTIPLALGSLPKLAYFMIEKNNLAGSAGAVCNNPEQVRVFAADCAGDNAPVACPCCTVCCAEGDDGCNDSVWLGDSNPIWELNYQRAGPVEFDASASQTYTITFGGDIP